MTFRLDSAALARAHASAFLAIDPSAIGAMHSLDTRAATARTNVTPDGVAVVDIMGPLAQRSEVTLCGVVDGYDGIEARLSAALADPAASAVMLRIDSPGGDAAGCFEAVGRMQAAVAASGKPVYAYADELAASAAFAVACVANAGIFLPQSGVVGSVGVIAVHFDESEALAKEGVKATVVRSGARKAELNPYEPLSTDALARLQGSVDNLAKQFAAIVAGARGMKASDVLALEANVFSGKAAVSAGLADSVTGWDAAMRQATKGGRAAARKRATMSISKKLGLKDDASDARIEEAIDELVADREALVKPTGKANAAEALGVVEAWKADASELAASRKALVDTQKKLEQNEASQLIEAAYAARKLTPASKPKTIALYEKHGLEALKAHVDALTPLAAATEVRESKQDATGDASTSPALTPGADGIARHNGLAFEEMSGDAKHNLRDGGEATYQALKADWERRGKPAAAKKSAA